MDAKGRKLNTVLFAAYCALMLWLLFDRNRGIDGMPYWEQIQSNVNLTPLHTIRLYLRLLTNPARPHLVRLAVINLFGNVLMFIPLGFFLPRLFTKLRKLWKTLLVTALVITFVELTQLLMLVGTCDIDDLLLNVIGAALGYGLYRLAAKT